MISSKLSNFPNVDTNFKSPRSEPLTKIDWKKSSCRMYSFYKSWGGETILDCVGWPSLITWCLPMEKKEKGGDQRCGVKRTWPTAADSETEEREPWAKKCKEAGNNKKTETAVLSQQEYWNLPTARAGKESRSPLELALHFNPASSASDFWPSEL